MKLKLQIATVCNCDTQVKLRKIFIAITAPCNCDRKKNCDCLQLRRGIKLPLATAIVCLQLSTESDAANEEQRLIQKSNASEISNICNCDKL